MTSNLPTYAEILERVKAQDWGHKWEYSLPEKRKRCSYCLFFSCCEEHDREACTERIAQAIKAAMVEAFKVSITKLSDAVCMRSVSYADPVYECLTELRETADALEKK